MTASQAAGRAAAARAQPNWLFRLLAVFTALHLAWGVCLLFDFVTHPLAPDSLAHSTLLRWILMLGVTLPGLVVATLVMQRAPGNISGLCLLLHCVLVMAATLRADSPLVPYNTALNTAWSGLWLLGLYFPDGQPQPARIGRLVQAVSGLSVLSNATQSFFTKSFALQTGLLLPNPVFIPALGPLEPVANGVQTGLLLAVVVLIPIALIVRYRVSDVRGRQQLKWLAWPFILFILAILPLLLSALLAGQSDPFASLSPVVVAGVALFLYVFPFVAVGTAILRHRLYDIDVIIRRTLLYAVLTGLLALTYFGSVVVLQNTFSALTGQRQSTFVTVLSTLIIAALFVPLRRRVQAVIDRRLFRRKYDAARTLAAFGAGLRDETNLDQLTTHLTDVVEQTLQPASVGLWLRPGVSARVAGEQR